MCCKFWLLPVDIKKMFCSHFYAGGQRLLTKWLNPLEPRSQCFEHPDTEGILGCFDARRQQQSSYGPILFYTVPTASHGRLIFMDASAVVAVKTLYSCLQGYRPKIKLSLQRGWYRAGCCSSLRPSFYVFVGFAVH